MNMKRRVINILNKEGNRRTFKFLPDGEPGIIIYSEDKPTIKRNSFLDEVVISDLVYKNGGPVIQVGNKIDFNKNGVYKILNIYKVDYEEKPNCYLLSTLKLKYDE
jgi:hypothetical protein